MHYTLWSILCSFSVHIMFIYFIVFVTFCISKFVFASSWANSLLLSSHFLHCEDSFMCRYTYYFYYYSFTFLFPSIVCVCFFSFMSFFFIYFYVDSIKSKLLFYVLKRKRNKGRNNNVIKSLGGKYRRKGRR